MKWKTTVKTVLEESDERLDATKYAEGRQKRRRKMIIRQRTDEQDELLAFSRVFIPVILLKCDIGGIFKYK